MAFKIPLKNAVLAVLNIAVRSMSDREIAPGGGGQEELRGYAEHCGLQGGHADSVAASAIMQERGARRGE